MNNNFDKMIKSMIENEPNPMSEEFKNSIKSALEKLPEDNTGLKRIKKNTRRTKVLLIASIITLFLITTAFASGPRLLKMTQNFIKELYKIDNLNIESKQSEYEKYNAPVNYTSESKGISVTINNIAVDGNFILITSTVTSPVPIKDIIMNDPVYKRNFEKYGISDFIGFLPTLNPMYKFKIDGKELGIADITDCESYFKNDYSFVAIENYIISDEMPRVFNLNILAEYVCYTIGTWSFDMAIDRSSTLENSITVTPNIQTEVTSIAHGKEYKHSILIDKLSISPFGDKISIIEKGPEPFRDFTLRDGNGNYYIILNSTVTANENGDIYKNTFEYIYPSTNKKINDLYLVPILTLGDPVEKQVMMSDDNTPTEIKISDIGGYTTENIEIDDNQIRVILKPYGAILQYRSIINGAFGFLDKNGSKDINKYINLKEVKYDKQTGNAVITGSWSTDTPDNISDQIGGFWYVEMPNMLLNEDEAIKIPLNK
ncbi:MAG: DUF4179 domain-containing protein [Sedimentibacter saalensis]|jgi:hypothetical protein|uniref:DUF4179 domain-containing protein n=1 Tax=Sedimentibacter saalensis TaxID=130788 RepID=UPI002B1ED0CC|nr:DUF4179 domain-containing protein [Sedimentibacter saalensis]MEA5096582.1 DUF4179 domain-containing protein [Sedimentibacter saalensis]